MASSHVRKGTQSNSTRSAAHCMRTMHGFLNSPDITNAPAVARRGATQQTGPTIFSERKTLSTRLDVHRRQAHETQKESEYPEPAESGDKDIGRMEMGMRRMGMSQGLRKESEGYPWAVEFLEVALFKTTRLL